MKSGSWRNEVFLEVGGFDVEMILIQEHIDIQKHDLGGRVVTSELDGIVAFQVFKELGEGVWIIRS